LSRAGPHVPTKQSREVRAKARLAKIKLLINAGKNQLAVRRLKGLIRDYPYSWAAVEAMVILSAMEDSQP
jgi:hypothetical protein